MKILIVDNEELTVEGLKAILLHQKGWSVASADGHDPRRQLLKHACDVLFVNPAAIATQLHEPVIPWLVTSMPHTRIILLGKDLYDPMLSEAIRFPIDGVILKCCKKSEVIKAIQAVCNGEKFFCTTFLQKMTAEKAPSTKPVIPLTGREKEIVRYLCEGKTTNDIAEKLVRSTHTITTHRKNILKKLRLKNTSELILYAINQKLIDYET